MTDLLYCLPGDEVLHTTIERCLREHGPGRYTIEVWDTHPPEYHMPSEDRLLEWLDDWAADNGEADEHWAEQLHTTITQDPVCALIVGILYNHLGRSITYRMAKDRIETREVIATLAEDTPDASLVIWNAGLFDTIAPESVRLTSWWCQCPPEECDSP